jgi:hypothetical protein
MALAEMLREESAAEAFNGDFPGITGAENGQNLAPDPEPGKTSTRRSRKATAPRAAAPREITVSKAVAVRNLTAELEMYAGILALSISARGDEVCGGAISAQSKELASSLAVLIARSEWLLSTVHAGGFIGDVVRVMMAAWPVATAVRAHHSGPRAEGDGSGGDPLAGFAPYTPA